MNVTLLPFKLDIHTDRREYSGQLPLYALAAGGGGIVIMLLVTPLTG
jgi:hypothetical protein